MMTLEDVTVVIVPGLRDHVPDHWQTHLQRRLTHTDTVQPSTRDRLSCAARVAALDATLAAVDGPVLLAAHSAGVMIAAHWALRHRRPIVGALLATPADLEEPLPAGYPLREQLKENGWLPVPRRRLPFPSVVAASRNDPLARLTRVQQLARDWGSRLVDIGPVGHLNPAAGYGEWPPALDLLRSLLVSQPARAQ
jgi:predicted alpha/beta hydrolase family esterase